MDELTKKVNGLHAMIRAAITMALAEESNEDLINVLYAIGDWSEELIEVVEQLKM